MREFLKKTKAFFGSIAGQIVAFIALLCAFVLLSVLFLNVAIVQEMKDKVFSVEDVGALSGDYDCILVLGCGVHADGSPSTRLSDRLTVALSAYDAQASAVIFVTGDSEYEGYSETDTMKAVLLKNGVPEEKIVCDGYGLSTYESMWRAKNVYGYKRVLIVTQRYHLYRALYIAEKMGLEADGLDAALQGYSKQLIYSAREWLARVKDFYYTLKMPKPKYTGK